ESVNNNRESLRGIDLNDALLWKLKQPANEQWASRYQGNYKVVENYIENSRKKARNNKILKNLIIAIFLIAPLALFAWYNQTKLKNISDKNAITQKFTDSLENKNSTLKSNLAQLANSLHSQKLLQKKLEESFENQQQMAKIKAESDLRNAYLTAENERKERIRKQEEKNREET
ncbi:MAG: hypothetical protein ABIO81_09750, partial [Ginsengibacter sp.]